jgi:hypothetical protein
MMIAARRHCEGVAEPEAVGFRNLIRDVSPGGGAFVGRDDEIRIWPVIGDERGGRTICEFFRIVGEIEKAAQNCE